MRSLQVALYETPDEGIECEYRPNLAIGWPARIACTLVANQSPRGECANPHISANRPARPVHPLERLIALHWFLPAELQRPAGPSMACLTRLAEAFSLGLTRFSSEIAHDCGRPSYLARGEVESPRA